jgi:hypothetical protein
MMMIRKRVDSNVMQCIQADDGVFVGAVESGLPFVVCTSQDYYSWNGALMDQERVIGLVLSLFLFGKSFVSY